MRLQCPNCDAEYEVGTSAIPFEGRDVQCSNCGHGWFQAHPDFETDYAVESALYDPPPPLAQGKEGPAPIPRRELDPEAMRVLREEVALEEAKRAEDAARANAAAKPAPQDDGPEAALDAMVANDAGQRPAGAPYEGQAGVYRPEQDRDSDLRDIEAELDADQNAQAQRSNFVAPAPRVAPRRVARIKGLNDDGATPSAPTFAAPPIAQAMPQPNTGAQQGQGLRNEFAADMPKPRKTSGGRAGFFTVILAALAAAAGYVFGPDLAKAVPQLAEPVGQYITLVNGLRDQVQVIVPQALELAQQGLALAKGAVQFAMDWLAAQGWI